MGNKRNLTAAIVILVIIIGLGIWYFYFRSRPGTAPSGQNQTSSATTTAQAKESLGGQIYGQAQNPLQDKLQTIDPIKEANPIQGLYKNPFQ